MLARTRCLKLRGVWQHHANRNCRTQMWCMSTTEPILYKQRHTHILRSFRFIKCQWRCQTLDRHPYHAYGRGTNGRINESNTNFHYFRWFVEFDFLQFHSCPVAVRTLSFDLSFAAIQCTLEAQHLFNFLTKLTEQTTSTTLLSLSLALFNTTSSPSTQPTLVYVPTLHSHNAHIAYVRTSYIDRSLV